MSPLPPKDPEKRRKKLREWRRTSKPLSRSSGLSRSKGLSRTGGPSRGSGPKARSFSERFPDDHDGPRYGPLFRAVRDQAKKGRDVFAELGWEYDRDPTLGQQGGPTAAHRVNGGRDDEGLLFVSGRGHDFEAGRGGREARRRFDEWLASTGWTLDALAAETVRRAEEGGLDVPADRWTLPTEEIR